MIKVILIYLIYLVNADDRKVGTCFTNKGHLPKNGYRDFLHLVLMDLFYMYQNFKMKNIYI